MLLDRIEADFHKALAGEIFGRDEETLEGAIGDLLRLRQKTLALAESCTGGLLAGRLTDVAGSSDYFLGSAVTYANTAKADLVGVSAVDARALRRGVRGDRARDGARGAAALRLLDRPLDHGHRGAGRRDAGEAGRDGPHTRSTTRTERAGTTSSSCRATAR